MIFQPSSFPIFFYFLCFFHTHFRTSLCLYRREILLGFWLELYSYIGWFEEIGTLAMLSPLICDSSRPPPPCLVYLLDLNFLPFWGKQHSQNVWFRDEELTTCQGYFILPRHILLPSSPVETTWFSLAILYFGGKVRRETYQTRLCIYTVSTCSHMHTYGCPHIFRYTWMLWMPRCTHMHTPTSMHTQTYVCGFLYLHVHVYTHTGPCGAAPHSLLL